MARHRVPPMKGLPPAVDLSELRHPQTPGSMSIKVNIRYALNCYADVNDAIPFLGVIDSDTGQGPPAVSFVDEAGETSFYVFAPNVIATLQQFLGIAALQQASSAAEGIVRELLEDSGTFRNVDETSAMRSKLEEVLLLLTDGVQADEQSHDDPSS